MTHPKYIAAFAVRWLLLAPPSLLLIALHFAMEEILAGLGRLDAMLPEWPEDRAVRDELARRAVDQFLSSAQKRDDVDAVR